MRTAERLLLTLILTLFAACASAPSLPDRGYDPPARIATLENTHINESSGVAASRSQEGIYWTHNDSGDGPFVYAFDAGGRHLGVWSVTGASARDWEDMAIGPGPVRGEWYLYMGDIGDNARERDEIVVYRVPEPVVPRDAAAPAVERRPTPAADAIRLRYPDGKHDAESLLVHPVTGDLYIVTKSSSAAAGVYKTKAPLRADVLTDLQYIAEFRTHTRFPGLITGGDISPDGQRVVLCDYFAASELRLESTDASFDDIWSRTPAPVEIGPQPQLRRQGEAVCYRADGEALLATSEGVPCPLIEVRRRQ